MKMYVFLTQRICSIGGAEQYTYNKGSYLESKGYCVCVFSGRYGNIYINDLKRYEKYIIPALDCCPSFYSAKEVTAALDKMVSAISLYEPDECVIESDSVKRAIWAELLARRLHCKHLAFVLQEKHDYTDEAKDFLRFKLSRHELAGITEKSVGMMLPNDTVENREDTHIRAYCNNVIDNCKDNFSNRLDTSANYTFGSVGRLEKSCVLPIAKSFRDYFLQNSDKRYNLVFIGGSPKRKHEKHIRKIFSKCKNVNLIITGLLYPIPQSLVDNIDLFVSTAGSAGATYFAGRPTVRVHPITGEPVGIIGGDFKFGEKGMYDAAPGMTIVDCIKRVIEDHVDIEYTSRMDDSYRQNMEREFDRQLSFTGLTDTFEYYDEELLKKLKDTDSYGLVQSLYSVLGKVLGGEGLAKFRALVRKALRL